MYSPGERETHAVTEPVTSANSGTIGKRLAETPAEKGVLAGELDRSRSTVDRAVRDPEAAGLVERTDGGYATTLAGRLAAER
jgi:Mn-dependent DtxR family transcriptional regulator